MTLVLLLAGLIILITFRVPVAISLLATSLLYILFTGTGSMRVALQQTVGGMDSFPLLAIPLFILLGNLAVATDIASRLFALADAVLGRVRGGLGYVNVVSSLLFSTLSHSAIADSAVLGRMQVPEMTRRGYDKNWSIGLTAGAALIGPILPPSVPAILYAVTAGVSIAGLFAASILPVVLVFITLCGVVFVYSLRKKKDNVDLRSACTYTRAEVGKIALASVPALLTPVLLIGGILTGYFTPTEAACVSVAYLAVLGLVYRKLNWKTSVKILSDSAATSGSIMIVLGASGLYGWILAREGAGRIISDWVGALGDNPILFLIFVNIVLLLVGTFMESAPAILIFVPILQPIATDLGIDPMHFGVIVLLNLVIGLLTPPVGMVLFVLGDVTKTSARDVFRGTLPFLGILVAALMVITFVPPITEFLPAVLGY